MLIKSRERRYWVAVMAVTAAFLFQEKLQSATFLPVINGDASMGQWYFEGKNSALAGNFLMNVTPAVRYSNRFALIPTIYTNYRGTRSAEELAGGNTLFQDTWENGVNLKAVHGLNRDWKLRENIGYRTKWFRETTNETFTNGLYDYNIANIGTEIERDFHGAFVALGYDFSLLKFPNYKSLESSQASNDLAREYAGSNVLDANVHLLSLRAATPFVWSIKNSYQVFYSPRLYDSQTVVAASGLLTPEKRKDNYLGANLSMERAFPVSVKSSLSTMLFYSYSAMDSNQNHYDARVTKFIPNFYSYTQNQIGTQVSFSLVRTPSGPMMFNVGYSYSKRDYSDRVTQTVDGAYNTEKLSTTETDITLGYSYPLARSLRLTVNATFGRSRSNNNYEAVYRYNYSNSNYLFGFHYEY